MKDYLYIRAWGRMMGSHQYYVDSEIEKARKAKAPQDATYYDLTDKRWRTFGEVTNMNTKHIIEQLVKEYQK